MRIPPMNRDLMKYIAEIEIENNLYLLDYIKQQKENPYGIEIKVFGNSLALKCLEMKSFWWNRVLWREDRDIQYLEDIIAWYKKDNMPYNIELIPDITDNKTYRDLAEKKFYQYAMSTTVYGIPEKQEMQRDGKIIRIEKTKEVDLAVDTWLRSMNQKKIKKTVRDFFELTFKRDRWNLYLGYEGNIPVAAAGCYIHGKNAFLNMAATMPKYRNRGYQTALLKYRIDDAFTQGCELVISGASPGTSSLYNMQKVGLRTAFTKSLWKEL